VFALAEAARNRPNGHPLWHYLVVAGAAVGVFLGIKVKEYVGRRRERRVAAPRVRPVSSGFAAPSVSTTVLATASILTAAIHGAVTSEHFREAFVFGVFFVAAAAAQTAWAILLVYRPSRALLLGGAIGNAIVIAVWAMSRTVGIPIGPEPWHPEAVGVIDVISKVFELVIIVVSVWLLVRRAPLDRDSVVERRLEAVRREYPELLRPLDVRTPAADVSSYRRDCEPRLPAERGAAPL
jgi:hypothetical protein